MKRAIGWVLIGIVRVYQKTVSPMLGPSCRFYPSCSEYACQALHGHGPARGLWLTVRRLLRCHPWHPGGVDMVPALGDGHGHRSEGSPSR